MARTEPVVCGVTITGPRVGRRVVLWVKSCARKTIHDSGKCFQHRGPGPFGPGAIR